MNNIEIGKVYKHFKGNFYYVKDIAICSESEEIYVVYQALYDDYKTYIRPINMFTQDIDINRKDNTNNQKQRFEKINLSNITHL